MALSDMIEAKGSSRHPLGQLAYRIISGNVWYDARVVLEDQKVRITRCDFWYQNLPMLDWPLPPLTAPSGHRNANPCQPIRSTHKLRRHALGHRQQVWLCEWERGRPARPMDGPGFQILQHSGDPVRARRAAKALCVGFLQAYSLGIPCRRTCTLCDMATAQKVSPRAVRSLEHHYLLCISRSLLWKLEYRPFHDFPGRDFYELLSVPVSKGVLEQMGLYQWRGAGYRIQC